MMAALRVISSDSLLKSIHINDSNDARVPVAYAEKVMDLLLNALETYPCYVTEVNLTNVRISNYASLGRFVARSETLETLVITQDEMLSGAMHDFSSALVANMKTDRNYSVVSTANTLSVKYTG